jgi:hypothetical protein
MHTKCAAKRMAHRAKSKENGIMSHLQVISPHRFLTTGFILTLCALLYALCAIRFARARISFFNIFP